ncbi:UBP-type zinc finger domain-containing protein [Nonomuraea sp. SYSU D8015]|uniref:UBP-type zinc finger domain-containing protein n=1 Tax=Nonomuraea sp. SYSU D8015 TaxID=2593644 RepID=UPI001661609D|nr:UBP-type zinc finger domain-containing protein [Nonomuraea sp. SYSU D8015]
MPLDAQEAKAAARAGLNGQAPRCDHIDLLPAVEPGKGECQACLVAGQTWTRLLTCLTCGWVACSDDSQGGHAKAHYEETDHPVVADLAPGSIWRWCYVHQRPV